MPIAETDFPGLVLRLAGTATATGVDQTLTPTDGWVEFSVYNQGPGVLTLAIDEDSLTGAKKLTVQPNQPLSLPYRGDVMHYSGDCTFAYNFAG